MNESGDKISLPFLENKEKALVTKLLKISEDDQDEKVQKPDALCGWRPLMNLEYKENLLGCENMKETKSKTLKNSSPKESNHPRWRNAYFGNDNPYREMEKPQKNPRKRVKYHTKRMEELSLPRKIRNKVVLGNSSKILLPFNDRDPFYDGSCYGNKMMMSRIALQYEKSEECSQRSRYKSSTFPRFQLEAAHSASDRSFVEKTVQELMNSKLQSHSAGSRKSRKQNKKNEPLILAKTRANVGSDWNLLPIATEVTSDSFSETSLVNFNKEVNLPLPQVKLGIKSTSYKNRTENSESSTNTNLPPIYPKTKRPIGSVTAITQGNIKAGIKSNSIRRLGRQVKPQTTLILPKLSGSKVEVPLLPQSPDFLHRML